MFVATKAVSGKHHAWALCCAESATLCSCKVWSLSLLPDSSSFTSAILTQAVSYKISQLDRNSTNGQYSLVILLGQLFNCIICHLFLVLLRGKMNKFPFPFSEQGPVGSWKRQFLLRSDRACSERRQHSSSCMQSSCRVKECCSWLWLKNLLWYLLIFLPEELKSALQQEL